VAFFGKGPEKIRKEGYETEKRGKENNFEKRIKQIGKVRVIYTRTYVLMLF
jgi:hypothetical protein